ncbi:hypothetical protein K6Y77_38620, partial [Burkholderia cenocepacia]|uniref:hypothetical protein n=1 Tax=Burkholderia cenocepacia TaxID=95486 RepID=UPI00222E9D07
MPVIDVDILFRGDSKPCDSKGEGAGGVSDVNNSLVKSVETLCKRMVSVRPFKPAGPPHIRRWRPLPTTNRT